MSSSYLQVFWAETGLENLKIQLGKLVQVAPADQILLIGPPYKVLDKQVCDILPLSSLE